MSAGVREQVQRLVEALRGFDPALCSGTDCAALAEDLAVAGKACAAAQARAAARAAECGAHRGLGYAQPADWLAKLSGSTVGEAKAVLETAVSLPTVPEVQEALTEGTLSLAQAREIARTEEARPGSAAVLVDVARRRGLQAVRDEGRRMRLAAVDPAELHRRQVAARSFRHWRDGEGMVCFRGALPPESGIPFVNRLDAECGRIRRTARRDGSTEAWEAGRGRSRSFRNRVARSRRRCPGAASASARASADSRHHSGGGRSWRKRRSDLHRSGASGACVRRVGRPPTFSPGGRPTRRAHRSRPRPAAGRKGGECAGGCGRRHGLEWDHRDPVAHGGPTSYDNIDPRCHPCHQEKTERDRKAGLLSGRGP